MVSLKLSMEENKNESKKASLGFSDIKEIRRRICSRLEAAKLPRLTFSKLAFFCLLAGLFLL